MSSEKETIQKLVDAIEDISSGENEDCKVGEDWSEAKITFMKKYGHMK